MVERDVTLVGSIVRNYSHSRPQDNLGEVKSNYDSTVMAVTNLVRSISIVEFSNGSNYTLSARFRPAHHLVESNQSTLGSATRNDAIRARWVEVM